MTTRDVLAYLEEIYPAADGTYRLSEEARAFFGEYLRRYGYTLDELTTKQALLDAIGVCNAEEFRALLHKPAPSEQFRFIWHRLRQMTHVQPGR